MEFTWGFFAKLVDAGGFFTSISLVARNPIFSKNRISLVARNPIFSKNRISNIKLR
jgi:hypothetical protein